MGQRKQNTIDEKLRRLHRERLTEQVERYFSEGSADEDGDLVESQAVFPRPRE